MKNKLFIFFAILLIGIVSGEEIYQICGSSESGDLLIMCHPEDAPIGLSAISISGGGIQPTVIIGNLSNVLSKNTYLVYLVGFLLLIAIILIVLFCKKKKKKKLLAIKEKEEDLNT
jgi:hypothetical protein